MVVVKILVALINHFTLFVDNRVKKWQIHTIVSQYFFENQIEFLEIYSFRNLLVVRFFKPAKHSLIEYRFRTGKILFESFLQVSRCLLDSGFSVSCRKPYARSVQIFVSEFEFVGYAVDFAEFIVGRIKGENFVLISPVINTFESLSEIFECFVFFNENYCLKKTTFNALVKLIFDHLSVNVNITYLQNG